MIQQEKVCVIIAAKDAEKTIGRAVRSALAQPEVDEVVVVDDGSDDRTLAAAAAADDTSRRLDIIRFRTNRGPSAARNHAIAVSRAPLISILDADDFFFPGRFRRMLACPDWDFIADNIAFMPEAELTRQPDDFAPRPRRLGLADFVLGNISRRGAPRGELGFLKPVMRRAFLDAHDLRYREDMRLGEDYELYVRALLAGARYTVIESCGYGAVVRADSLSGQHRTKDLEALYEAERSILSAGNVPSEAEHAMRRHCRQIGRRHALRHFLDRKREGGARAALAYAVKNPSAMPAIAGDILRDKLQAAQRRMGTEPSAPQDGLRYLLPASATR
ncbi:glycosyl transferase family A [Shinella sumterensis]|uniref:glycosyltransferase family 2 protein n=1 Tax=Shinella sumterensis TaxID=1967501 RepID=UPI00106EF237|nr:glycosyltransferase family A protein [Shinella sumterensis]MCD1262356.1 glycosyltransferase [Shinella sumterensis]TFE99886.1 glycosyl transferase family A [Shinella sumterensis]